VTAVAVISVFYLTTVEIVITDPEAEASNCNCSYAWSIWNLYYNWKNKV
jgi:hypothetical protein